MAEYECPDDVDPDEYRWAPLDDPDDDWPLERYVWGRVRRRPRVVEVQLPEGDVT